MVAVDRAEATFRIDKVIDPGDPAPEMPLEAGREVRVQYPDADEQYLNVGSTYQVGISMQTKARGDPPPGVGSRVVVLASSVDGPNCWERTVHEDTSTIDTGFFASPGARGFLRWALGVGLALVLLAVTAATVSGYVDRREASE